MRMVRGFLVASFFLVVLPISSLAHSCLLFDAIYLEEWHPGGTSVLPNSICIYPDGRTGIIDAVLGELDLEFHLLAQLPEWPATGCELAFMDVGIDFGHALGNIVLCGNGTIYSPCEFLPCNLAAYPIAGGGHSPVDGSGNPIGAVWIIWSPDDCDSGCSPVEIELYVNSPDINGDLNVNLTDLGFFNTDLGGGYNFRSDFNFDGVVNVTDAGYIVAAFGAGCQ